MSPQWQRLRGGTSGAAEKVDARPNRGAVRRYFWERSVSFVHSANPTAAEAGGGGTAKKGFSDVLSAAQMASDVPLCYLRRDSDDSGPPIPRRSSENTTALTGSYQS